MTLDDLKAHLSQYKFIVTSEAKLQAGLAQALEGFCEFQREFVLSPSDRPDFWLPDEGIAIEVKIKGSPASINLQLLRYARHEVVKAVLLIASDPSLLRAPAELAGKPVATLRVR